MERDRGRQEMTKLVQLASGTGQHAPLAIDDRGESFQELAQIVHDLKNPLSAISLDVEVLHARLCARPDVATALDRIRRNVGFLDRLIYDLLDVYTTTNGRLALHPSSCDLTSLLESVIGRVVPTSDRSRVFFTEADATIVQLDELRIERVIANLLDNALRYTPPSSGVVVRLSSDANNAHVSVCDAGPGLSAAEIDVVFEPYRRASSSVGRAGNGLGLYVCKRIVEAHGGRIGVESVRGEGARFYFALPRER